MKADTDTSAIPSDSALPEGNDAERKMRLSLGLGTASRPASAPTSPSDPMKTARQAIRSQAAARDYAERQLSHAEAAVEEFRTKLRHAHREKATALEAARVATAARMAAQRSFMTAEAALATEKSARERGDRALREAQATIRDLQERLDTALRGFETVKADLAAERQARQKQEDARREKVLAAPAAVLQAEQHEAVVVTPRRPVGRPRKEVAPVAGEAPVKPAVEPVSSGTSATKTAARIQKKPRDPAATAPEPVQWWVEGWNRRKP